MSETIELQVKGGQASGGPPLGPKLGPTGINIQDVVGAINEKTATINLLRLKSEHLQLQV